jgi:hypothetical protein
MNNDIFDKVDKDKLEKAVQLLKDKLGPAAAARIDSTMSAPQMINSLTSKMSQKDKDNVVRLINNPMAMKALLSSPKVAELVKQFMDKGGR